MDNVWVNTAVFVGWLLGGIIGGATGIGAIMIAMPILTMVLAPGDAVLVSCLVGLYGCIHLALAYRRDCKWADIRDLGIGVVPGCVVGVLALKIASVRSLELMISVMLAVFVLLRLFRGTARQRLPESAPLGVAAGAWQLACRRFGRHGRRASGNICAAQAVGAQSRPRQHERAVCLYGGGSGGDAGVFRSL